ncbi:hypothetical protein Fcan01_20788 [Folsomia candida]|uniref:Uncharacterized protein n=1 Tax=Folsomia candida TaxID=158441 RepID=A0A226DHZ6_FOLCA|nr:hypothetical protein Fcan01_20788 [Folsomia candida]
MTNFNKTLLVMAFAFMLFCFISVTSGDADILNTNDGVDSTLSRLQKAISSSYEKFQGGEFNYDLYRNFGDGMRLFLDVSDPIDIPIVFNQQPCVTKILNGRYAGSGPWLALHCRADGKAPVYAK